MSGHPDLVLGIPLYSDTAVLHDYIVQARGAFDQTVLGLHQLARSGLNVEIRIVLHRLMTQSLPCSRRGEAFRIYCGPGIVETLAELLFPDS